MTCSIRWPAFSTSYVVSSNPNTNRVSLAVSSSSDLSTFENPSCSSSISSSPPTSSIMKNTSKSNSNKLSSCFRPVVDADPMLDSPSSLHRSSSLRFACVPLPPKHPPALPRSHSMSPKYPYHSTHHHPPKRTTFTLAIKSFAFDTILNTIRARPRSRRGSKRRSSSSSGDERTILSQPTVDSNIPQPKLESPSSTYPLHASPSSCSSPVSESDNSSSKSHSTKPNRIESRHEDKSVCVGIFMVLAISLTFTVIWGKCWASFLTSTWLYFFSLGTAGKLWPRKIEGQNVDNRGPSPT